VVLPHVRILLLPSWHRVKHYKFTPSKNKLLDQLVPLTV
jgi:hypothetical protein